MRDIEELVRNRQRVRAHRAIQHWMKRNNDLPSKMMACDWYRRLGDVFKAYQTIKPKEFKFHLVTSNSPEAKQYLWCARILNLMGASAYALQIVERLPSFQGADENQVIGNIYLSNFEPKLAIPFLKKSFLKHTNNPSYRARFARLAMVDALMETHQNDAALNYLNSIHALDDETLFQGILLQVKGEALARMGKWSQAMVCLKRAHRFYPKEQGSLDYLFLSKWTAIATIGRGRKNEGLQELDATIEALQNLHIRPEIWLDCIYWKWKLGLASAHEMKQLQCFPGIAKGFSSRYDPALGTKTEDSLNTNVNHRNRIYISLQKKEWKSGKQANSILPKEIELLGLLRNAHPQGLHIHRASSLLWPDEVGSFLFLEERIHQLLKRLRQKYKIRVKISHREIYLNKEAAKFIAVQSPLEKASPFIFETKKQVSFKEIGAYYQIKRTRTHQLIKKWESEGRVKSEKVGRNLLVFSQE